MLDTILEAMDLFTRIMPRYQSRSFTPVGCQPLYISVYNNFPSQSRGVLTFICPDCLLYQLRYAMSRPLVALILCCLLAERTPVFLASQCHSLKTRSPLAIILEDLFITSHRKAFSLADVDTRRLLIDQRMVDLAELTSCPQQSWIVGESIFNTASSHLQNENALQALCH